jgi:hypothetical protein
MNPLRPSLLESNPSSIQPNQVAQNIFCGETSPANGTDVAVVLTVLSAMFPLAFFSRAIWRGLLGKAAAGNGREVSGMGTRGALKYRQPLPFHHRGAKGAKPRVQICSMISSRVVVGVY